MYRLYRSRDDRMLAGVAGGLAELWGADPSLVRVIWALLVVFTGGVALIVYIVMALVVPEEPDRRSGRGQPFAARPPPGAAEGWTPPARRHGPLAQAAARLAPPPAARPAATEARFPRPDPGRLPDHPRRLLPGPRLTCPRSISTGSGRWSSSASASCPGHLRGAAEQNPPG